MESRPIEHQLVDQALTHAEKPAARARTMEMLLSAGFFPSIMHILVVCIVAVVISPKHPLPLLIAWVAAFATMLAGQGWLTAKFGGRRLSLEEAEWLNGRFNLTQLGVGLLWGFCGGYFFPSDDVGRALLFVFVLGGMAMSSVATQHPNLRFCLIQITLGIAPLAINYFFSDLPFAKLSGFFLFLYLAVLASLAIRQNRFAHKAINLQVVQERLLNELSAQAEELEQARQSADEANASKSRFLAQASHDLRQPLHAMSLFVESLPSLKGTEQYDVVLNKIRQSLDILTKLFDSLLDVTMLDTGGIEVNQTAFPLQDILDQVVNDFRLVAEANNVEITVLPTSVAVNSDPVLLTRILQNLISNTISHAPGKRALVGCRRRGGKISLIVADNGPGIDRADQHRVFAEFERLDTARMGDAATPGLGLGLSIVRRVASEMGLTLRMESEPDRITIFEIGGLEVADAAKAKRKDTAPAKANLLDQLKVFVLDDNIETLEATELLLTRWGCDVATAQSFDGFPDEKPDLVICDYEIGLAHNGLDVLRMLEDRHQTRIAAVVISGHGSKELRDETAWRGLVLLHKPLRPAPLRSALLNAITASAETS